jgi:hypothetical protein
VGVHGVLSGSGALEQFRQPAQKAPVARVAESFGPGTQEVGGLPPGFRGHPVEGVVGAVLGGRDLDLD